MGVFLTYLCIAIYTYFIFIYLLSNHPSRDLQGGKKLACGAGSQKPETENYTKCRKNSKPGPVTWSTDNLQFRQAPEEPHNLGSKISSAFSQYLNIMTSHFYIKGYLLSNYPSRDLQGDNKLACGVGSQKPERNP